MRFCPHRRTFERSLTNTKTLHVERRRDTDFVEYIFVYALLIFKFLDHVDHHLSHICTNVFQHNFFYDDENENSHKASIDSFSIVREHMVWCRYKKVFFTNTLANTIKGWWDFLIHSISISWELFFIFLVVLLKFYAPTLLWSVFIIINN